MALMLFGCLRNGPGARQPWAEKAKHCLGKIQTAQKKAGRLEKMCARSKNSWTLERIQGCGLPHLYGRAIEGNPNGIFPLILA